MAKLVFRILGCGASSGVPRIGDDWGNCDRLNTKNRRLRAALLVTRVSNDEKVTRVLIDTGPDLREQLLSANISWLDAVLYTHAHADHTHGIDDLRPIASAYRTRLDLYMDALTASRIHRSFGYCFRKTSAKSGLGGQRNLVYAPIANYHVIKPGDEVIISGAGGPIPICVYEQVHGEEQSLGFKFGKKVAYSTDVSYFVGETVGLLSGLDFFIIEALRWMSHASHLSVMQSLQMIEKINPRKAFLTHMHVDLDYDALKNYLPDGVEPAYDGLEFSVLD